MKRQGLVVVAIFIIAILLVAHTTISHSAEAKKKKQYKVRFFVTDAYAIGRPVYIKAEVDKEHQILITSETVNAEKIIKQSDSSTVRLKTLTVKDRNGQHPGQVWACLSGIDASTSPGCHRLIHQNSNQYVVYYDYYGLIQDLN